MKIFSLSDTTAYKGLIFDIDQTLYRHEKYYKEQSDVQLRYLSEKLKRPYEEVSSELNIWRQSFAENNGGRTPSLANTFLHAYNIDIQESSRIRSELINPSEYLERDETLIEVFKILSRKYAIMAVTNNSLKVGQSTLNILGVDCFFSGIIGLDTVMVSKPHEKPFTMAARQMSLEADKIISIGDRYEIDLEIPLQMGMAAILVENMADVYQLKTYLT